MNPKLRKILLLLLGIGFMAGLVVLLYPLFSNEWNKHVDSIRYQQYQTNVTADFTDEALEEQWEQARTYNSQLKSGDLAEGIFREAVGDAPDETYMACLNTNDDGVMGYLSIPKIDELIPIYHTTNEDVLQKGVGHVEGSSLPVGGEGTHVVLAAHRGLPGKSLFTDIDQLEEGDQFYLHVLNDVLAYEVDDIRVVLPDEVDGLGIIEGKDYVTLVTCTPYGLNTHRLLIRGHRVPYVDPDTVTTAAAPTQVTHSVHTNYLLWILLGFGCSGAAMALVGVLTKRRNRRRKAR